MRSVMAMLLTIGILIVMLIASLILWALGRLVGLNEEMAIGIGRLGGFLVVLGTAIWAGMDAHKLGMKNYRLSGPSGPGTAVAGCVLLWIIFFPWYLINRGKLIRGEAPLRSGADELKRSLIPDFIRTGTLIAALGIILAISSMIFGAHSGICLVLWGILILLIIITPLWMLVRYLSQIEISSPNPASANKPGQSEKSFAPPIQCSQTPNNLNTSKTTLSLDKISVIEKLANMRDSGILSEEEFQSQKKEILSRN